MPDWDFIEIWKLWKILINKQLSDCNSFVKRDLGLVNSWTKGDLYDALQVKGVLQDTARMLQPVDLRRWLFSRLVSATICQKHCQRNNGPRVFYRIFLWQPIMGYILEKVIVWGLRSQVSDMQIQKYKYTNTVQVKYADGPYMCYIF